MRSQFLTLVLIAALALGLSCFHNRGPKIKSEPTSAETFTIVIDSDCDATYNGSPPPSEIRVNAGDEVCWTNTGEDLVKVRVENGDQLYGTEWVEVPPGETVCRTVYSGADNKAFFYGWYCCPEGEPCTQGGVGGPTIKVGC